MITVRTQVEFDKADKLGGIEVVGFTAELRENSRAVLWGNSRAELWGNSHAELRENSHAELRGHSHAELRGHPHAVLWGNSVAYLYNALCRCQINNLSVAFILYDDRPRRVLALAEGNGINPVMPPKQRHIQLIQTTTADKRIASELRKK